MELALVLAQLLASMAPVLLPLAQDLLAKGINPMDVDWGKLYGRSIEALRAEVDVLGPQEDR